MHPNHAGMSINPIPKGPTFTISLETLHGGHETPSLGSTTALLRPSQDNGYSCCRPGHAALSMLTTCCNNMTQHLQHAALACCPPERCPEAWQKNLSGLTAPCVRAAFLALVHLGGCVPGVPHAALCQGPAHPCLWPHPGCHHACCCDARESGICGET